MKKKIEKDKMADFETKGYKYIFKCNCGKEIIVITNLYDNSKSGKGTCECGAVIYVK
jgi:hypothetical protein